MFKSPIIYILTSLLILLLLSNGLTLRKDKSILFPRLVILGLISSSFLAWNNLFIKPSATGIGIYGGLFNVTTFSQTFNIFIFIISAVILTLTAFYPRKIHIKEQSSLYNMVFFKLLYNKNAISNKMGKQFRIIEYSLIIVYTILLITIVIVIPNMLLYIWINIAIKKLLMTILLLIVNDCQLAKLLYIAIRLAFIVTDFNFCTVFNINPSASSGYEGDISRSASSTLEHNSYGFGILVPGLSYNQVMEIRSNIFQTVMRTAMQKSIISVTDIIRANPSPNTQHVLIKIYSDSNLHYSPDSIIATRNIGTDAHVVTVDPSPALKRLWDMRVND